jgi:hypothetical protein
MIRYSFRNVKQILKFKWPKNISRLIHNMNNRYIIYYIAIILLVEHEQIILYTFLAHVFNKLS